MSFNLLAETANNNIVGYIAAILTLVIAIFAFKSLADSGYRILLLLIGFGLLIIGIFFPLSRESIVVDGQRISQISIVIILMKSWMCLTGLIGLGLGLMTVLKYKPIPKDNTTRLTFK